MADDPIKSTKNLIDATDRAAKRVVKETDRVVRGTAHEAEFIFNEANYRATRLRNRMQFALERLILRGAGFRLLVIAAGILLVATGGGLLANATTGTFDSPQTAVWWAFLRMTDPGYLGDDEGATLRAISTVVTITGYVLFTGALIAIMTQWLHDRIRKLELGLTPLVQRDHVLVVGWTSRTADIVRALMMSEGRVKRFLLDLDTKRLNVVLLVEEVTTAMRVELQEDLGPYWDERRIAMRSGTGMSVDHLRRADFDNASVIIIPGDDYSAEESVANDTRSVKSILSIDRNLVVQEGRRPPALVAEIFDSRKAPIARSAYRGRIDVVASDGLVGRLLAQSVRNPGMSHVFEELLTPDLGNELYVRTAPQLAGMPASNLYRAFPKALLLGFVREVDDASRAFLNPGPDVKLESDDRLLLVARRYEDCAPPEAWSATNEPAPVPVAVAARPARRILVLGWSHKATSMLAELASYASESFEVDVCSTVPSAMREREIQEYGVDAARLNLRQIDGDYAVPGFLASLKPAGFDGIVMVASDRLRSSDESDARTILGFLMLRQLVAGSQPPPAILMELMQSENRRLFPSSAADVLPSPKLLSCVLVQVALRREVGPALETLFGPDGPEMSFANAMEYLGSERDATFEGIQSRARARGEIALGVRLEANRGGATGGIVLNPDRSMSWSFGPADSLVILTTDGCAPGSSGDSGQPGL